MEIAGGLRYVDFDKTMRDEEDSYFLILKLLDYR